MTLDEAIEYAEKNVPEPDIAHYLKEFKAMSYEMMGMLDRELSEYRQRVMDKAATDYIATSIQLGKEIMEENNGPNFIQM